MAGLIGRWAAVATWMAVIYWGSSRSTLPELISSPSWQGAFVRISLHLAEYAILATLLWLALDATPCVTKRVRVGDRRGLRPPTPWLTRFSCFLALALASSYAVFDEWHQSSVPLREADLMDLGIDVIGAVIGLGFIWVVIRCRMVEALRGRFYQDLDVGG